MKGKKVKHTLRSIQARILNGYPLITTLSLARADLPVSDFMPLLSWLMTATRKGRPIGEPLRQTLFPKSVAELRANPVMSGVGMQRELQWFTALLLTQAKRLNSLITSLHQVELAILVGDRPLCKSLLDTMENDSGASLWLIEANISILQYFEGVEAHKGYLNEVKERAQKNIGWIAHSCSSRNEVPTTFFNYLNQTIDTLDTIQNAPLRHWLKYQTIGFVPEGSEAQCEILRYQTNASLLDAYIAFFDILQQCALHSGHEFYDVSIRCAKILAEKISDVRLYRLLFLTGHGSDPWQSKHPDGKLHGKVFLAGGGNEPGSSTWPLLWKCAAEEAVFNDHVPVVSSGFAGDAVSAIFKIYSKGAGEYSTLTAALKRYLNFRWMSASQVLQQIVSRELSSWPVPDSGDVLVRFIYTDYLDPTLLPFLPITCSEKYRDLVFQAYFPLQSESQTESNVKNLYSAEVLRELEVLSEATLLLRDGQASVALVSAMDILESSNSRVRHLAARLACGCLIEIGDKKNLVSVLASAAVRNPQSVHMLPIDICAGYLDRTLRRVLSDQLSTSIVLSLYSRYHDDSFDSNLSFAYEDFLIGHDLDRPSELIDKVSDFNQLELVYYLRYICTPEIMKVSSVFQSSVDIQDERLAVCTMLLELDPGNSETYESEIRELTRAQAIRSGVRRVEQSKMSIDTAALKKWADKKLLESFLRYKALIKAGIRPSDHFEEAYLSLLTNGTPIPLELLQVPTDEAGALFQEILRVFILEATINPMYGLDCYLSMRVRHGALSGQLRGPLELQGIITQRQSNGSYATNDLWMERLDGAESLVKEKINIELCIFSARYDAVIEKMTNEWVQIRSEEKPGGLFDMKIALIHIRMIALLVSEETTFDEFFDHCVNVFWSTVEPCLEDVRQAIDQVLKVEANQIFGTLQGAVDQVTPSRETAELTQCIRTAHTNLLQAMEQAKDWFRLPAPREEPFFEIEQLIDIGLQCVQRIHRDFNPIITKSIPELPPLANALTFFSDVFFILFDNARKYSNAGSSPKLHIEIKRTSKEVITLTFENHVEGVIDLERSIARVEGIKAKITSGDYQQAVRSEGGTGLIKLKRIIGPAQRLDFGHTSPERFKVSFDAVWREIALESLNS